MAVEHLQVLLRVRVLSQSVRVPKHVTPCLGEEVVDEPVQSRVLKALEMNNLQFRVQVLQRHVGVGTRSSETLWPQEHQLT